jgi:predicted  nucleic acid-binding Zn-ribbon protein
VTMAEDGTKKELLSQVTDAAGEKQLADQIRTEISKRGEQLTKFLALVASFEDDIPNEAKRYAAAIKAMTAAAGLKKEDLLAAADQQITALDEQRNELLSSMAERRSELKIKEQKAKDIRKQIDLLTESIKRLEGEEKELVIAVASGETEVRTLESKLGDVIKGIEKDVTAIKDKINEKFEKPDTTAVPENVSREMEQRAEAAISSMVDKTKESVASSAEKGIGPEEPKESYEDEVEDEKPGRKRAADEEEHSGTLKSPIEMAADDSDSEKGASEKKKTCPVCSNPMDWYSVDENWKCFVCGHEESG